MFQKCTASTRQPRRIIRQAATGEEGEGDEEGEAFFTAADTAALAADLGALLADRELRNANVFDYLARAGFRTALIDAQSYSRRPPNLMTRFDLEAAGAATDGASPYLLFSRITESPS